MGTFGFVWSLSRPSVASLSASMFRLVPVGRFDRSMLGLSSWWLATHSSSHLPGFGGGFGMMVQRGSRLRSSLGGLGVVCGGDVSVVCLLLMCSLMKLLSVSSLVCVSESRVVSVAVVEIESSSECFGWVNSSLISLGGFVGGVVDGVMILAIVSDSALVLLSPLCCVSESLIVSVSVVSSVSGYFSWISCELSGVVQVVALVE